MSRAKKLDMNESGSYYAFVRAEDRHVLVCQLTKIMFTIVKARIVYIFVSPVIVLGLTRDAESHPAFLRCSPRLSGSVLCFGYIGLLLFEVDQVVNLNKT
jgi:hypothetical protein